MLIKRGNQYEPASTTATSVTVQEADRLPVVSIVRRTSGSGAIPEGRIAGYTVTAAHPVIPGFTGQINAVVAITQVGNFLLDPNDTTRRVAVFAGPSEV